MPSTFNEFKVTMIHRRFALVLFALILGSSGCSLFSKKPGPGVISREQVYFAPYEDVERAVKRTLIKYPQRIDNPEAGVYETDFIRGELRFQSASEKTDYSEGYRYRILVRMIRGKSTAKPAVKVIVSKRAEIQRDFFSDPEPVPSDGQEETVILYRVQRELALEKAMRRAGS